MIAKKQEKLKLTIPPIDMISAAGIVGGNGFYGYCWDYYCDPRYDTWDPQDSQDRDDDGPDYPPYDYNDDNIDPGRLLYYENPFDWQSANNVLQGYVAKNGTVAPHPGMCATAVTQAMVAATGKPYVRGDAGQGMIDKMSQYDYVQIPKEGYQPQAGDVITEMPLPGHTYGHTAMYDGTHWVSDFQQSDMWGGSGYRNYYSHGEHEDGWLLWRHDNGFAIDQQDPNNRIPL